MAPSPTMPKIKEAAREKRRIRNYSGGFAGRSQGSVTIRNSSVTVNGAIHGKAEDYHGTDYEGSVSRAHTGGFAGEIESGTLTMTDNALFGGSNGAIGSGALKSYRGHKSDRAGGVVGVVEKRLDLKC